MCYFVEINLTRVEMQSRFGAEMPEYFKWEPMPFISGFAFPQLPVLLQKNTLEFIPATWGLIPYWVKSKEKAIELRTHTLNAMAESVQVKPSFKQAFARNRCILPVNGFFEWHHQGKVKYPFHITQKEAKPFSLAGILDYWTDIETGEISPSFSIITTPANSLMSRIHNSKKRMPAILHDHNELDWINPGLSPEKALALLKPFPDELMEAQTIAKINPQAKIDNSGSEMLKPYHYPELVW
jgi:putative SOS response-associated peptidase YedK